MKPLTHEYGNLDGVLHWTKARCEPSQRVDFSGVLQSSVKQAVKEDLGRFRIVAPVDEVAASFEKTGAILQTSVDDVAVINLLPKTKAEAAAWSGYSSGDKSSYVEWGQRIDLTVQSRNIASISDTGDPALVVQQLKEVAAEKKVVVIVGEAQGNHHVRLPGTGVVSVRALREALPPDTQIVGLFCGSANSLVQVPGLAVQGKLQASEAAGILRSFLRNVNTAQPLTVRDILPVMAGLAKATGEKLQDTFLYLANNQEIVVVIGGVSISGYLYLTQDDEEPSDTASTARLLVE